MPQNNEIVAALPASGNADKDLLRSWAVTRNAYCLAPDEDCQDFVMIDPDGGGTVPAVIQNGLLYGHDPDDSTTAHDGVICLVSYDAQRYKIEAGLHAPFNVLDKDLTAPPVSPAPSYGDAYLIYGSPTGAWAGKSGYIAIFTARGWSFSLPPIGFLVYIRDESSFYHRNNGGAWTLGTGTRTLGANSVTLSNAINFGKRLIVENQTTNAPPGSPSTGDAYIIGPSPTGAWSGHTANIAVCEDGSTFTIYTPTNGWAAYDKAQNNEFRYSGSAWVSAAGALLGHDYRYTASGSTTGFSGSGYSQSATTAPTTSNTNTGDDVTIAWTARKTGAKLRFTYQVSGYGDWRQGAPTFAIFIDGNAAASAWVAQPDSNSADQVNNIFLLLSGDALAHTYKIRVFGASTHVLTNRLFQIEELS